MFTPEKSAEGIATCRAGVKRLLIPAEPVSNANVLRIAGSVSGKSLARAEL